MEHIELGSTVSLKNDNAEDVPDRIVTGVLMSGDGSVLYVINGDLEDPIHEEFVTLVAKPSPISLARGRAYLSDDEFDF